MQTIYETERLKLIILDKSKADKVVDFFVRNKDFLEEWETVKNDDFYTIKYHERLLEAEYLEMGREMMLKFWIFKKEDDSKTIGSIAFNNMVKGAFLSCFLGYRLDKDEINKGYMTEALQKGIEVVFNQVKLHRIEANIMPKNSRSLRVVEKLGFYNEGIARNYLKINGNWEDHIHMVLLNEKLN
jgi:[ribosomal protein S5]-alanine N-acetyltransferase